MPPTIALLGLGAGRWLVPLPIPLILAWPLIGVALGMLGACELALVFGRKGRPGITKTVVVGLCQLRGLKVDVARARGGRIHLWMI